MAIVVVVALIKQGGYGLRDLPLFSLLSVGFAVAVGGVGALWVRRSGGEPTAWHRAQGSLLGALVGGACLLLTSLLLGGMAGAASLPLGVAWILGGASGIAFSAPWLPGQPWREAAIIAATVLVAALLFEPVALRMIGAQQLEVIWLSLQPGPQDLSVVGDRSVIGEPGLRMLRDAGVQGEVAVLGRGLYGAGPRATVYMVLTGPVTEDQALRQPDRELALYVQEGSHFRLYPPTVDVRDEVIELVPETGAVWFHVRVETLGGTTGTSVSWKPVAGRRGGADSGRADGNGDEES